MTGAPLPLELRPVGPVPRAVLAPLALRLDRRLGTRTRTGAPLRLALPRGGLASAAVVDALLAAAPDDGVLRLALVEAPLAGADGAPVLGEAAVGGGCACVSLPPLRSGRGRLPAVYRRRLVATAVHEAGHARGLPHCADARCVMYPSRDIADTDRKGSRFCARCLHRLRRGPD